MLRPLLSPATFGCQNRKRTMAAEGFLTAFPAVGGPDLSCTPDFPSGGMIATALGLS